MNKHYKTSLSTNSNFKSIFQNNLRDLRYGSMNCLQNEKVLVVCWFAFFTCHDNEPPHDKTNKIACGPSEDSDQPGHPPTLIRST